MFKKTIFVLIICCFFAVTAVAQKTLRLSCQTGTSFHNVTDVEFITRGELAMDIFDISGRCLKSGDVVTVNVAQTQILSVNNVPEYFSVSYGVRRVYLTATTDFHSFSFTLVIVGYRAND